MRLRLPRMGQLICKKWRMRSWLACSVSNQSERDVRASASQQSDTFRWSQQRQHPRPCSLSHRTGLCPPPTGLAIDLAAHDQAHSRTFAALCAAREREIGDRHPAESTKSRQAIPSPSPPNRPVWCLISYFSPLAGPSPISPSY